MGTKLLSQIKENLSAKSTDELLSIWTENDGETWSKDALKSIKELLTERGVSLPEQKKSSRETIVSGSGQGLKLRMKLYVGMLISFGIVLYVIVILFGQKFDATEAQIKETEFAQKKLSASVFSTFQDVPKIEVTLDYSARLYIQKKNYMAVPYPYRAEAIASIGKTWCDNPGAFRFLLPKVVLRDFQTGEELACYRCCVWGNVSIN